MKWIMVVMAAITLAGCESTNRARPEPIIKIVEIKIPIVEPCPAIDAIGPAPEYPDADATLKSAANLFERVKLLVAGRIIRMQREAALNAAIDACKK